MVAAADAAGAHWELHYGGRSRRSMAFLATLDWLTATGPHCIRRTRSGCIDLDAILGRPRPGHGRSTAAGPSRCWPRSSSAAPTGRRVRCTWSGSRPRRWTNRRRSEAFEVELATSGQTLTVPPDKSILEVVEDGGVAVLSSCREGTCGTCETAVLDGEVDHRDSLLTPDEQAANDTMFICVSRAAGPKLVLDL